MKHAAVAILACTDLDESQSFYARLGFRVASDYPHHGYRILTDDLGADIHLTRAEPGWVTPGRNPFGVYIYSEQVRALAAEMGCACEEKPWGLVEFALSDPDGTLVRVGWEIS